MQDVTVELVARDDAGPLRQWTWSAGHALPVIGDEVGVDDRIYVIVQRRWYGPHRVTLSLVPVDR